MVISLPRLELTYPGAYEMVSLDDPGFYSPQEIFSILESWGDEGRSYQLWLHLTWDLVVPILGFFVVGFSVSWLLQRSFKPESGLQKLNLLALGSVFDLLENVCIIGLVSVFPARPAAIAWLKTIFTAAKYGFAILIVLLVLTGLTKSAQNRFEVQKTAELRD